MPSQPDTRPLGKRLAAEGVGTFFFSACVIGSAITAHDLSAGSDAAALLGNALAIGAMLFVLLTILDPISGAHINPAVSLVAAFRSALTWPDTAAYIVTQVAFAIFGAWATHLMFGLPSLQPSFKTPVGLAQWVGEFIAAFGLILTILGTVRFRREWVAPAVGLYIAAAYWFNPSTTYANPAITLARSLTKTLVGIAPHDVAPLIAAALAGAACAAALARWLFDAV
jgi:glycerol uptake facilitator-like aquaporin